MKRGRARARAERFGVRVAAAILAAVATTAGGEAAILAVSAGDGGAIVLTEDRDLFLEAVPLAGEGLLAFSRRLCGSSGAAAAIAAANGGSRALLAGVRYRVPFHLLAPEQQIRALRALFAEDQAAADGWRHTVRAAGSAGGPTLWHIADWFTGRGENFRAIREYNGLADDDLEAGQVVVIPAEILRPALRAALPPAPPQQLAYEQDERGEYAVYRLRVGEALYSSVVVRLTGRVFAVDVNSLAGEIAERSGITDVTDIPVGYPVKIPFELLLPEFLPPGHPRRQEYEAGLLASARFSNPVTATHLEGITVVLDAGHGGKDVGTSLGGVWESLYVYDIALRVKRLLEGRTSAAVHVTTRDGDGFDIPQRDVLPFSRAHRVLTHPPYAIEDPTVGVHLRWYLANSLFRSALAAHGDPQKVVFLSIHADSLHPSLRGVMAYIPGAEGRGGAYGKSGAVYASRQEVLERPRVTFSDGDLVKSEGLSRQLATSIIGGFERQGLAIHPFKPVREKVIRNRRAWVPAVLRYNEVPAKVLLEVCNLSNPEDRALIQTRAFRERVAAAVVEGILDYYRDGEGPGRLAVASAGR